MKLLLLTNVPKPRIPEIDAHYQELNLLSKTFDAPIVSAYPFSKPTSFAPASWYGLRNLSEIKRHVREADCIHVFSPVMSRFAYMRLLKDKYVVYTTLTRVTRQVNLPEVDHYIVTDTQSQQQLSADLRPRSSIAPLYTSVTGQALDVPRSDQFTLLMASAPWVRRQFDSKGVTLLIELLEHMPDIRLRFVWRGMHTDHMQDLIKQSGHSDRIDFIDVQVKIQDEMAKAHAVVLLASTSSVVKSYPHSLVEGLIFGRPIITTNMIPISDYVEKHKVGVSLQAMRIKNLVDAVTLLRENYDTYRSHVLLLNTSDFSAEGYVDFHRSVYAQVHAHSSDQ